MKPFVEIFIKEEVFYLLPQKAMYRPSENQLILSDIHLGKATHFRKQGIAMPPQSHLKDIDTLYYLLNVWKPKTVLIVGDLFHSEHNREWLWFKSLLNEYNTIQFILIEGNHDILKDEMYNIQNLIKIERMEELNLIFSHHPLQNAGKFNICGHIHPGLQLYGNARQSIKLPCFYKSATHLILPAFGNLTGLHLMEREKDSDYYLITENGVVKL